MQSNTPYRKFKDTKSNLGLKSLSRDISVNPPPPKT